MAKSNRRPVDKIDRQQRLANARRIQELEQQDLRQANRLGWQEAYEDEDYEDGPDPADDYQWSDDEAEAA